MYPSTPTRHNPWEDDRETFGTIGNVLTWAYRTGHLKRPSQQGDDVSVRKQQETEQKYPSSKLIKMLQDMTDLQKKLHQVNTDIQCSMQDKETSDVTHITVLEKRINQISDMNEHFQSVVKDKDSLINRLQQPFIGDFMKVEATYQKHVKELLIELSPVLSDLASHLDNITWASHADFQNNHLDFMLSDIASALAGLQTSVMSMSQMRSTMNKLHTSVNL